MNRLNSFLFVVLWCVMSAHGQQPRSTALRFDGCYEVTSLSWNPPDESIKLIPPRFELTPDNHVRPLPWKTGETAWGSWTASGNKLKISFGFLGGFRGTLKPSSAGRLNGKLKEWCDSRCEWHKRVGIIRIRKIDCRENDELVVEKNRDFTNNVRVPTDGVFGLIVPRKNSGFCYQSALRSLRSDEAG
jgi:hypothetical protein